MKNRMQYLLTSTLLLALSIGACQRENDKNPAVIGKWQGQEWLVFGKPSGQDAAQVRFEFREDGSYAAIFGQQSESGVWRTVKEKLYTTASDKKEKVVGFRVEAQTLTLDMNRAGQQETIILTKQ